MSCLKIQTGGGETQQHYDILTYACYVTFFPQLIAGPIVKHDELIPQFLDETKKTVNWDNMAKGVYIFTLGLAKKVLLADVFGNAVNAGYIRPEKAKKTEQLSKKDREMIKANLKQNVISLAEEHPETEFYLFFPPYSIYSFDSLNQQGALEKQLDAEKYALELLLQYDNIHMFSFFGETDLVCDLDHYKDIAHYSEDVNEQMLNWMAEGYDELTLDNYEAYCKEEREFYLNYNYDGLFE